jgi:oligoribonuclease NrnB/cAMP/cGMP phosphodiesterase (DHH superfamily)
MPTANEDINKKNRELEKLVQKFLIMIKDVEANPKQKDNLKKEIRDAIQKEKF